MIFMTTTATPTKHGIFENAEDRNYTFEDLSFLINNVTNRHATMIRVAHMDLDDVRQELALEMLRQLDRYDPSRCPNLEAHLTNMLNYHLLDLRASANRHGIKYAPAGDIPAISLNQEDRCGNYLEIPVEDVPDHVAAVEQEIEALPKRYRSAIDRLLQGKKVAPKTMKIARARLRRRLEQRVPQLAA